MRKLSLFLLLLFILTNASAQKATDYRKQQNYKEWVHIAPKFDDDFLRQKKPNALVITCYCINKLPEAGPRISICRQN